MKKYLNDKLPLVSIVIPCRNEGKYIERCLDSIVTNDYPSDKIEALVVDGMSEDNTLKEVKKFCKKYQFIKLINNPNKIVSSGLNIGIQNSTGKIVIIIGTHTIYDSKYISNCVRALLENDADCVGGVCMNQAGRDTLIANAITFVLGSRFGVGNAYFRIGLKSPKEVDTVPYGCYKKEVFNRIGLFNEKLIRNQDIEFNLRLKKAGGKILLVPDILSYYIARSSLRSFLKNNFLNGLWNIYTVKIASMPQSIRHYVPLIFVCSLIFCLVLSLWFSIFQWLLILILFIYFFVALVESASISFKKGFKYFFVLPFVFFSLHLCYGIGSLWGLLSIARAR